MSRLQALRVLAGTLHSILREQRTTCENRRWGRTLHSTGTDDEPCSRREQTLHGCCVQFFACLVSCTFREKSLIQGWSKLVSVRREMRSEGLLLRASAAL